MHHQHQCVGSQRAESQDQDANKTRQPKHSFHATKNQANGSVMQRLGWTSTVMSHHASEAVARHHRRHLTACSSACMLSPRRKGTARTARHTQQSLTTRQDARTARTVLLHLQPQQQQTLLQDRHRSWVAAAASTTTKTQLQDADTDSCRPAARLACCTRNTPQPMHAWTTLTCTRHSTHIHTCTHSMPPQAHAALGAPSVNAMHNSGMA